jgi:hypothetical protein
MNTHYSQDEFVLAYYGEPDLGTRREHLDSCAECREELARLARVLDQVTPAEVPEPDDDYEARVWDRLSWRLRGEKKHGRQRMTWLAAAAAIVVAFIGGLLVHRMNNTPATHIAANTPESTTSAGELTAESPNESAAELAAESTTTNPRHATPSSPAQQSRDRILLVVVGDHFDESERMLVELTNITANENVDVRAERARAEELLASNRLYRTTALERGEDRVATLLDELEPVLMQLAHAPEEMSPDELRRVQKRVETKGLVFKLRVLRADVRNDKRAAAPHVQQPNI